jgi:phosphoglycolate phosphatase
MHLIFDFDGTLVNSFYHVVKKTSLLADEFNFRKIKDHEIESLRDLTSLEVLRFLEIPIYNLPRVISRIRKHLHNDMPSLAPVANIRNVLEKLYNAHFSLGILTSNSVENVTLWLDIHDMRHYFDYIHAESRLFSKKHLMKKTLERYKIDKSTAFYIGDETRDIDAARKNAIHSVAVTWGYNSEKVLLQHQPSFMVRKPEELLILFGLQK